MLTTYIEKILNFFKNSQSKFDTNFLQFLKRITNSKYKNLSLYEIAFTHRSMNKNANLNNERMEFLGDSILQAIFTVYIYNLFPEKSEGDITKIKSLYLSRKNLGKIAKNLQLIKYLKYSGSIKIDRLKYVEGNILEAFVGAIFLDLGFQKCYEITTKKIFNEPLSVNNICYKSSILEWAQKEKKKISFTLQNQSKKIPNLNFTSVLKIDNKIFSIGSGENKLSSQQEASKIALKKIKSENL